MPASAPSSRHTSASAARAALLALWQAGDRYTFIDRASRYLAIVDDDAEIALWLVQALVELGLGGPARELVDQRSDLAHHRAHLRHALAGTPTGRVPWQELEAAFDENLRALETSHSHLFDREAELRDAIRGVQLFRDANGRLHLSRRVVGRPRQWVPAFIDSSKIGHQEPPREQAGCARLIIGLSMNDLIEQVHAATEHARQHGAVPLYVVEPDWARFAAWLHTGDRRQSLASRRVHLFAGQAAADDLIELFRTQDDLETPRLRVASGAAPELVSRLDRGCDEIRQNREASCRRLIERNTTRSRSRSPAQWAAMLAPGATILGVTSRFTTMLQYSMRDIARAIEEMGCRFHLLIEQDDHRLLSPLLIGRAVEECDPALIILINHFRHELPQAFSGVPMLTWIQDPLRSVLSAETGRSLGPLDFVCGYYRHQCVRDYGYPPERFLSVPFFPVSTHVFHEGPIPDEDVPRFACDLMYAGHFHGTPDSHHAQMKSEVPANLHPLVDRLYEEVLSMRRRGDAFRHFEPRRFVDDLARSMGTSLPEPVATMLAHFHAYRIYDLDYRQETLQWAGEWASRTGRRFHLHGNGWENHPTLAAWARGPLNHGEMLRRAYRAAALVLQTIPSGFWHQRTFEALTSGTPVISRATQWDYAGLTREEHDRKLRAGDLAESTAAVFPGLDRVCFADADELAATAERLLSDAGERRELAHRFGATVRQRFSYSAAIPHVIDQVRRALAAQM